MSRNIAGNYSLPPAYNPVVSGSTILSDWANTTLNDVANELTSSLDRSGRGGMLAPLRGLDGTNTIPALSFTSESGLGLFRSAAGKLGVAGGGGTLAEFAAALTKLYTLTEVSVSSASAALTVTQAGAGPAISTTGSAALGSLSLTTDLAVTEGGTGASTAAGARTNLGASTVGANMFTLANPSAITFLRVNADNTISTLDAAGFRTAIGAGTGGGDFSGPGSSVSGNIVTFNGSTGKIGQDSGKSLPSGAVVGTTDTQTLSGKTIEDGVFTNGYTEESYTANTGTAYTIGITNGTVPRLTLTGNCTFTFPTPTAGKSFALVLGQDGTGSRTATWPASVKWPAGTAPTLTATASRRDRFSFVADGTSWLGSTIAQNYT